MADVLRRTGTNFTLIAPDLDATIALNGSAPGDLAIPTASFVAVLWEDGEPTPFTLADLLLPPFLLTIDNVSEPVAPLGQYRVNLTLPNRSVYELWIRHTTDMVAFRREGFDLRTRAEGLSQTRGNTQIDFTVAAVQVSARNVAVGVLDSMRVRTRLEGAPDFTASNLVSDEIVEFVYATVGDTNPIQVRPQ